MKEHSKSSLQKEYSISRNTLVKWLKIIYDKLPRLKANPRLQKITPAEYKIIKDHFGEP